MKFSTASLLSVLFAAAVFAAPLPQDTGAEVADNSAPVPAGFKDWAEYNKGAVKGGADALKGGLRQSADGLKQAAHGAKQTVTDTGKAAVDAVTNAGETAAGVVVGGTLMAVDGAKEAANKGKDWVVGKAGFVAEGAGVAWNGVREGGSIIVKGGKEAAKKAGYKVQDGTHDRLQSFGEWVQNVVPPSSAREAAEDAQE